MKKIIKFISLTGFVILLGCESTGLKEKFNFSRTGPDEFTVLSYKSLSVPPDFELPNPEDISSKSNNNITISPRDGIKEYKVMPSTGEAFLLQQAGEKVRKEDNIRLLLEKDNIASERSKKSSILDLFFKKNKKCAKDVVLDPEADKNARDYKNKSVQILRKDNLENKKTVCDVKNGVATNCEGKVISKEFSIPISPKIGD
ncbi:MAG: DUF3035 domain-containing protein [Rickettsiales endosymbiont of Dermacentor nuttalli]